MADIETFLRVATKPINEDNMLLWIHRDTILVADRIADHSIFPSPSQNSPFITAHSSNVLWGVEKDVLVVKGIIRGKEVDAELTTQYREKLDEGDIDVCPIIKDGTYQCLQAPLPYYGYWVGREGFTYQMKGGKITSKTEWPALQDLYFSYALTELKLRTLFWWRTNAEMNMAAQLLSTMLLSANLREFLRIHPLKEEPSQSVLLSCVATIEENGNIRFSPKEKDLSSEEEYLFQHLSDWVKTLPPFAFNGYYTHDGQYLPFRLMTIYYKDGKVSIHDPIEITRRFRTLLKS